MGVRSGAWRSPDWLFFGVWLEQGSAFAADRHCPLPRTALWIVNAFFWTSELQKGRAPASRNSLSYASEVALAQRKYCGSALASGSTGEPFMETRAPIMFRRAMAVAIYTALAIPLA
jgi:hypothetical protein